MFITFEGGDGSGKTTQAKKLVENLNSGSNAAVFTREPGGTEAAEKIRGLLLEGGGIEDAKTEFMLVTAARLDHVNNFILPKLSEGKIVVCDRFYDSTVVYQGFCKGLDMFWMNAIHKQVFGAFEPNMTIMIDVDHKTAQKRMDVGRASTEKNHYDDKDVEFKNKVRDGFKYCAKLNPGRINTVDGNRDIDIISREIFDVVSKKLHG